MLTLDRLGRPCAWFVVAEDLAHQQELQGPAEAAFLALRDALEVAAA